MFDEAHFSDKPRRFQLSFKDSLIQYISILILAQLSAVCLKMKSPSSLAPCFLFHLPVCRRKGTAPYWLLLLCWWAWLLWTLRTLTVRYRRYEPARGGSRIGLIRPLPWEPISRQKHTGLAFYWGHGMQHLQGCSLFKSQGICLSLLPKQIPSQKPGFTDSAGQIFNADVRLNHTMQCQTNNKQSPAVQRWLQAVS